MDTVVEENLLKNKKMFACGDNKNNMLDLSDNINKTNNFLVIKGISDEQFIVLNNELGNTLEIDSSNNFIIATDRFKKYVSYSKLI